MLKQVLPLCLLALTACGEREPPLPPMVPSTPFVAPEGWTEVRALGSFSIMAPPGTEYVPLRGIDSFVGQFIHPDFEITCDQGMYSAMVGGPAAETLIIGGRPAQITSELAPAPEADPSNRCKAYAHMSVDWTVDRRNQDLLYIGGCVYDLANLPQLITVLRSVKRLSPPEPG